MSNNPVVTKHGVFDLQVCVPKDWTDEQVEQFANSDTPAGTMNGWKIRRQGGPLLAGCAERVQCADRRDCVHIMLDC